MAQSEDPIKAAQEKARKAAAEAAAPAGDNRPEVSEDAGTKALSDALRSSFAIIKVVMVVLVVVFLCSGLRVVKPQEKAVILRFGKPVGAGEGALLGPGAHWAYPYPIDELVRIPIGQVQTVESSVGWYATTAAMEAAGTEPPPRESLDPEREGYLLTADENIIHVRGKLRYRISEPGLAFAFDFAESTNMVRDAFNNALVYASARYRVDDILNRDVAGYREMVRNRLSQLIGIQGLGILVDQIELQAIPPRQLKERFDAVLETEVTSNKELNDAKSYASTVISRARAEAAALRSGGETDRKRMVEFLAAEARRFHDLLPSYERNPELFLSQVRNEALSQILTNAREKFLLPARDGGLPDQWRIHLNRQPQRLQNLTPSAPAGGGHDDEH